MTAVLILTFQFQCVLFLFFFFLLTVLDIKPYIVRSGAGYWACTFDTQSANSYTEYRGLSPSCRKVNIFRAILLANAFIVQIFSEFLTCVGLYNKY